MRFTKALGVASILWLASSGGIRQGIAPPVVEAFGQNLPSQALDVAAVVDRYCAGCHNGSMKSPSGALLNRFDAASIAAAPELWSRIYRQLQAGAMPPAGAARPDRMTTELVLASIERELSSNAEPAAASSQEIATRLAAMLWNSVPDAALRQDAQRNRLGESSVLEGQIRRMLQDERAQALVARFFFPWLELDKLPNADPDSRYFPDYDVSLRDALAKETELFVLSQLRDDRDPLELWSARYTFLNERLAKHYGIPNVLGSQFRRIELTSAERGGLLGQGSILMVTSRHQHGADAAYTTPATRAKWIRAHFLGVAPPNPFPGAQPVRPELPITPQTRLLPAEPCVNCHRNFFPLGYALENFDPIGRWRTQDQAGPVDASGAFVDGTPTNGIVELRQVLLQYPEAFRTSLTESLLAYASGGSVNPLRRNPEALIRAREILSGMANPQWSKVIAAIARTKKTP